MRILWTALRAAWQSSGPLARKVGRAGLLALLLFCAVVEFFVQEIFPID